MRLAAALSCSPRCFATARDCFRTTTRTWDSGTCSKASWTWALMISSGRRMKKKPAEQPVEEAVELTESELKSPVPTLFDKLDDDGEDE